MIPFLRRRNFSLDFTAHALNNTNAHRPPRLSKQFIKLVSITLLLLIGTSNQNLDNLALGNLFECLLGLLKGHHVANELLDVDLAAGEKLDGQAVIAATVAERALGRHLLEAQGHDGEGDVGLAHAALDVGAAHAHRVQAGLDAGLGAAGVNDHVGAVGPADGALDVVGVVLGRDALRGVRVRAAEPLGELELAVDDIHAADRGGAKGLGHGGAQQAHGARAHDHDGLARGHGGLADYVHGDGQGLDQGALLRRHVVGQLVAEVGGGGPEARQGAVVGRGGGEAHLGTEVVVAREAGLAAAAGVAGLEGDAVAFAQSGYRLAHGHDGARTLVAQHHGVFDDKVANGAVVPVVHVGAADARVVYGYEDVMGRAELGYWPVGVGD